MKRVYKTPKAVLVDFCYDEQVVATSGGGNTAQYGDPNHIGRCQQSSETTCVYFWLAVGRLCEHKPFSLLGFPVA